MSYIARRSFAAFVVTLAVGAWGFAAPASAHRSDLNSNLGCDPVVVAAAIDAARADARAAQKRFTTHTNSSMKVLVKKLKTREEAEAKMADKKADRLAKKAAQLKGQASKQARAEAKAARAVARAEVKEAAYAKRASFAESRKLVKAERQVLKAQWNVAKKDLRELRAHAQTCVATSGDAIE